MECIDTLLRAGADRSLRDMDGKTALDAAIEAGREDCARALNLEMGDAKVSYVHVVYSVERRISTQCHDTAQVACWWCMLSTMVRAITIAGGKAQLLLILDVCQKF